MKNIKIGIIVTLIIIVFIFAINYYNLNVSKEQKTVITQLEIQNLMLNTIDNFKKAEGNFVYSSDNDKIHFTVKYNVDISRNASVVNTVEKDEVIESIQDGKNKQRIDINHKEKRYIIRDILEINTTAAINREGRYSTSDDGAPEYVYREDPSGMGAAANVIFPQEIALGYLEDLNKWKVESGKYK